MNLTYVMLVILPEMFKWGSNSQKKSLLKTKIIILDKVPCKIRVDLFCCYCDVKSERKKYAKVLNGEKSALNVTILHKKSDDNN